MAAEQVVRVKGQQSAWFWPRRWQAGGGEGLVVSCAVVDGAVSWCDQLVVAGASRLINDWPDPPPLCCKGVPGVHEGLAGCRGFHSKVPLGLTQVCRGGRESPAWGYHRPTPSPRHHSSTT